MTQFTVPMIESMLVRLIRTPEALQETATILRVEHFRLPDEQHYALLWKAVLEVYEKYGSVEYQTLVDTIQLTAATLTGFPEILLADLLSDSNPAGLVVFAYHGVNPADLQLAITRDYVRKFLRERYVYAPLAASLASGDSTNLPEMLADASERYQRILQVDKFPVIAALPDDWSIATTPREVESTGVPFLDIFMDGGHAPGDTNGILGPMGVGKTTMAATLAVGVARTQQTKRRHLVEQGVTDAPLKIVYLVTYEQSAADIQILLRANAASIQTSRLAAMRHPEQDLSSCMRGDYQAYEHAVHMAENGQNSGTVVQTGEYERLLGAREILRNGIQIVDLSGVGSESRSGDGGVEEVAALISQDQQRRGNPGVACVIVDYVLLAVNRWLNRENLDETKHKRHAVANYVDRSRLMIGGKLKTPVWLLHQLNNEGNKGDPTKVTSHTQASESSAFAAALVYCACLGTKDPTSMCTLLNFSKTRRSAGLPQPIILHINGAMARMEEAGRRYAINYNRRRIEFAADMAQVNPGTGVDSTASEGSLANTLAEAQRAVYGATPLI